MSGNILLLVLAGGLGLIALGSFFLDGVKYGFGEDGSLMTPAQVSVILKAVGGLFLVALVVVGSIWIYNELDDDKTDSREFTSEEFDELEKVISEMTVSLENLQTKFNQLQKSLGEQGSFESFHRAGAKYLPCTSASVDLRLTGRNIIWCDEVKQLDQTLQKEMTALNEARREIFECLADVVEMLHFDWDFSRYPHCEEIYWNQYSN